MADAMLHRQSVHAGQKLLRSRALQQHYAERDTAFNAFRIKRATVNEEQRQQTVAAVRRKAKESVSHVADHLKEHVSGLEKLMEEESTSTHSAMRATIESMVEKRRLHVAQEDADSERKLADARSRATQERKQLVERLHSETAALKNRVAAFEAGAALSLGADVSDVFAAQAGASGAASDEATRVSSLWFRQQRARIVSDAATITSEVESSLGALRGQLKTNARINDGSVGLSSTNRYERVDELRLSLDQSKTSSRDAWLRLAQRIDEMTSRIAEIESGAGVLRADAASQSIEAEAVRHEWEREIRQLMFKTTTSFASRGAESAVTELALALRNRVGKARDMMSHLRTQRNDALGVALSEGEDINAAFEQVLLATTKLLDKCPELAAASSRAALLTEIVEKDAALLEEEQQLAKDQQTSWRRVKELAKRPPFAAAAGSAKPTSRRAAAPAAAEEEQDETDATRTYDGASSYAQQHQHRSSRQAAVAPRSSSKQHRDPAVAAAKVATAAGYPLRQFPREALSFGGSVPSQRARQDPFVARVAAVSAAGSRSQSTAAAAGAGGTASFSPAPHAAAAAAQTGGGETSFEQLVDFSDASSTDPLTGSAVDRGVQNYRTLYAAAVQQQQGGYSSSFTPTPDSGTL